MYESKSMNSSKYDKDWELNSPLFLAGMEAAAKIVDARNQAIGIKFEQTACVIYYVGWGVKFKRMAVCFLIEIFIKLSSDKIQVN